MNEGSLNEEKNSSDFIRTIVAEDIKEWKNNGQVHTRFPPEPNGYLHIGHAKSICLNFGIASEFNGLCNLRFDDTNPVKEDTEYVDSIMEDVRWLGFDWEDRLYYASDYFDTLYGYAEDLIKSGKAYVCDLSADEVRKFRGTLTEPGENSPFRDRSIEENLDLFVRMKNGEFNDGDKTLRAKIDMSSPNINMRDPALYRIKKANHHRTGDKWCIYPTYDFTHGQSDALEEITHSICTLEFEDHRPLYNWFIENLPVPAKPRQIEFARLNLTYTLMSKRKLLDLVNSGTVKGWDDPRMPTICGLRRRGFTPESIRDFCMRIGVAKADSVVDYALLNHCLREDLNKKALRVMAVINPLKVIITNYPQGDEELLEVENNPEDSDAGKRKVPFSSELYIEKEDFMEEAPKKYFRLAPGKEVRLKGAYYITCHDYIKDSEGNITEVHCTYDPKTKGGWSEDGRKVRGTLHWVSSKHAIKTEVRMYEHLFNLSSPKELADADDYKDNLNPESLKILEECFAEPYLQDVAVGENLQFLRHGYFCKDKDSLEKENPVFNRTVPLRDSWAKKR